MSFQTSALKCLLLATGGALWLGSAGAAPVSSSFGNHFAALSQSATDIDAGLDAGLDVGLAPDLQRQVVNYPTNAAPYTVVIDTEHTYLYYVLGNGKAIRYGIGVGRDGFKWSCAEAVSRKAAWPDWTPPQEMIARQPYLPRWMAGGESNPLGARAIYLGNTMYRIHGTNMPETIGHDVSSGCIRLLNDDVIDLYSRVNVGTKIMVLPNLNHTATVATSVRR
jgi:lipoprotein-anchoring transpeptidase ErfK/SrfK